MKTNINKRVRELIAIHNSQSKVAKILKINQSTVSRLANNKIKNTSAKFRNKINSSWRYNNKRYRFQPRAKVKLDAYDYPVWVSGHLVEAEDLETALEDLKADLEIRYATVDILLYRTRRFDAFAVPK
jgi:transcriptional regulator with XRE-family HTH domain